MASTRVFVSETVQMGVDAATPTSQILKGPDGIGTDKTGGNFALTAGASTGTGKGGNVQLKTSPSAATGTTENGVIDRHIVVAQGKALTDNTAVSLFEIALPTLSMTGGVIHYTVRCTDGTDMQSESGVVTFASVNKGAAYTDDIDLGTTSKALSAGTLVSTWSILDGTNKVTIQIAVDTSLTPTGTNGFVVYYEVFNHSQQAITIL